MFMFKRLMGSWKTTNDIETTSKKKLIYSWILHFHWFRNLNVPLCSCSSSCMDEDMWSWVPCLCSSDLWETETPHCDFKLHFKMKNTQHANDTTTHPLQMMASPSPSSSCLFSGETVLWPWESCECSSDVWNTATQHFYHVLHTSGTTTNTWMYYTSMWLLMSSLHMLWWGFVAVSVMQITVRRVQVWQSTDVLDRWHLLHWRTESTRFVIPLCSFTSFSSWCATEVSVFCSGVSCPCTSDIIATYKKMEKQTCHTSHTTGNPQCVTRGALCLCYMWQTPFS